MHTKSDIKKVQSDYLQLLESHLPDLWKEFEKSKMTPLQFLLQYSPSRVYVSHSGRDWTALSYQMDRLLDDIFSFWLTNQQSLQEAINRSDKLFTQVGDLNARSNHYSMATLRLGLYFDSICLLDPFAIAAQRRSTVDTFLTGANDDPELTSLLISYLQIRCLKPILVSDTDVPIAIIMPPAGMIWGDRVFKQIESVAESNTVSLLAEAMGEPFESRREIARFLKGKTIQELEVICRNHWVLRSLFDEIGFNSLDHLVEVSRNTTSVPPESSPYSATVPPTVNALIHLFGMLQGAILAIEGAEVSAANMHTDLNIPKSYWTLNKFRASRDAEMFGKGGLRDEIPIQAAIMSKKMDWMSATNVQDLVHMREEGIMEGVREIYRTTRRELQRASLGSFESATEAVIKNVTEALKESINELQATKKKSLRGWLTRISQFTISGALGIASLFYPPLGLLGFLYSTTLPSASITDLIKEYHKNKEIKHELAGRPIIHMLEIWKRSAESENDTGT
jgi:hypothetical protein